MTRKQVARFLEESYITRYYFKDDDTNLVISFLVDDDRVDEEADSFTEKKRSFCIVFKDVYNFELENVNEKFTTYLKVAYVNLKGEGFEFIINNTSNDEIDYQDIGVIKFKFKAFSLGYLD